MYKQLSISACPIARFGNDSVEPFFVVEPSPLPLLAGVPSFVTVSAAVEGGTVDVGVVVVAFPPSAVVGVCAWVGLSAPYILKLSVARRHCSTTYGQTDSRKLPIICRDINRPANC